MILTITPVMDTAAGFSIETYAACAGIATVILIALLIAKELLDSSEKEHLRHAVLALDMAIIPLLLTFAVIVAYKVLEVLSSGA